MDNELGCHVPHDFSDDAAVAFRRWLEDRYGTVESLNDAWGTAFWSQRYDDFDEVLPPRSAPTYPNPTQQLDFARFSSTSCWCTTARCGTCCGRSRRTCR